MDTRRKHVRLLGSQDLVKWSKEYCVSDEEDGSSFIWGGVLSAMSDIGVWILYRHWCIIYTIGKSEDKLYYIAESIDSTPYSVKSRGMETDSYNEALMVWLSWSGEISLMCRRQCLVNQAVNPCAQGFWFGGEMWVQIWRFSFWLIEYGGCSMCSSDSDDSVSDSSRN